MLESSHSQNEPSRRTSGFEGQSDKMVWEPSLEGRSLTELFQQQTKHFPMARHSRVGTTGKTAAAGLELQPAPVHPLPNLMQSTASWAEAEWLCSTSANMMLTWFFRQAAAEFPLKVAQKLLLQLLWAKGKNLLQNGKKNHYLSKDQAGSNANTMLGRAPRNIAGELLKTPT